MIELTGSRTSSVDDIVENFSKAHLAEEAKIKKALDKTVPAPTRMASARAGEVAAHLRDANFDFRILDKGLRQRDLITLKPTQWLNDEVINTYLTMVRDRSDRAGGADGLKDVYEMSTFFYQKLSQQGYEKAKLARWTKRAKVSCCAGVSTGVRHGRKCMRRLDWCSQPGGHLRKRPHPRSGEHWRHALDGGSYQQRRPPDRVLRLDGRPRRTPRQGLLCAHSSAAGQNSN